MKRLTTITIVLMIPTVIASFFGMNVKIPYFDTEHKGAFFMILIISLVISSLVALLFRRRNFF